MALSKYSFFIIFDLGQNQTFSIVLLRHIEYFIDTNYLHVGIFLHTEEKITHDDAQPPVSALLMNRNSTRMIA